MVSLRSLFPARVLMRKFYFAAKEWYFLVLSIMRLDCLVAGITDQELTWIILSF